MILGILSIFPSILHSSITNNIHWKNKKWHQKASLAATGMPPPGGFAVSSSKLPNNSHRIPDSSQRTDPFNPVSILRSKASFTSGTPATITYAQISTLKYLSPPVSMMLRVAAENTSLNGVFVPKGTYIVPFSVRAEQKSNTVG